MTLTTQNPVRTAAEVFGEGLVAMTHPDPTQGNRNFEPHEVEAAFAKGFEFAPAPDNAPRTPSHRQHVRMADIPGVGKVPTQFGLVAMQDALGSRNVDPSEVASKLEKGWTLA